MLGLREGSFPPVGKLKMTTFKDFVGAMDRYLKKNPERAEDPVVFYWKEANEVLFLQGLKRRKGHYYGDKRPVVCIDLREPPEDPE